MLANPRQEIDRQKVHQVHQEDPHEHGQCQWRNQLALTMVHVLSRCHGRSQMIISTNVWNFTGTPLVAFLTTPRNMAGTETQNHRRTWSRC